MTTTNRPRTATEQAAHRAEFIEHLAKHATDADLAFMVENGGITQRTADEAKAARPAPTPAEDAAAHVLAGAFLILREDAVIRERAAECMPEEFAAWCATSTVYAERFAAAVREVGRIAAGGAE